MKNFRKVLALILVVATLFSIATVASAKTVADYKDGENVSYVEAVDVLSAIGILNGYEDGSFKPTNNIRRDEMAKMVAVLSNAGDDVSELYADACDFADCKGNWAKSYIAYCAETGVVAGRNATTFDPTAKVTGLETAKMLLVVLGFSAKEQGYLGSHWDTNVLRDAKEMGLLNGFAADYNVKRAITREEAAQMFLNALQANMVAGYLSNNIVKITNDLVYMGKDANGDPIFTVTLPDATKFGWVVMHKTNAVVTTLPLYTIYGGYLQQDIDADCYGNPGVKWTLSNAKKQVIFEKVYTFAPTFTYTKKASLATDLKVEAAQGYSFTWYVDGVLQTGSYTLADIIDATGKGVLTNVYVSDASDAVIITIKNTYIGEVDYITKKANTFTLTNNAGTFSNKGYGFNAGDVILYWICADGLHAAKAAEPTTVDVTRATTSNGNMEKSTVTGSGKVYEYAKNFDNTADIADGNVMGINEIDGTYDLFLDEYGYIMSWIGHNEVNPTLYAYAVEKTGSADHTGWTGTGADKWFAEKDFVDFDAKYTEKVEVDIDGFAACVGMYNGDYDGAEEFNKRAKSGFLYQYKMVNGKATWTGNVPEFAGSQAVVTADGDIQGNGWTVYGTSATKYLVRTWDYNKGEYVYTAFTGKLDKNYVGMTYTEANTEKSTIQYFVDGRGFASYVFVDAIYTAATNRAFVLGYNQSVTDSKFVGQIGAYDEYSAIIGGEESLLLVTHDSKLTLENWLYTSSFECIGLDDNGKPVYHATKAMTPNTTREAYEFYKDRLIVVKPNGLQGNVYRFAEDCVIVVAFKNIKGNMEYKTLETPAEINDFLEDMDSILGQGDGNNFIPGEGWMVLAGGKVAELYLVID